MNVKNYLIKGTLTAVEPLATCSKDLKDSAGKNAPIPVPSMVHGDGTKTLYFPSSGLTGTMRRRANACIHRLMSERLGTDKPFSIDEIYQNVLGGIKGSGDEDKASVMHEQIVRERNPVLSLFGAGDAGFIGFMKSKLEIGNAIAPSNVQAIQFSGARSNLFYQDATIRNWLSADDLASLVVRAEGDRDASKMDIEIKALMAKSIKLKNDPDAKAAIDNQIAEIQAKKNEVIQDAGTSTNRVGRPIAGYLAIPPSTTLTHNNRLHQASEVELGLFVALMNEWSLDPIIGAHKARGCGTVAGTYTIQQITHGGLIDVGTIEMVPHEPAHIQGEALQKAHAAFLDFMAHGDVFFGVPTKFKEVDGVVVDK